MVDAVVIALIVLIIGGAVAYIIRAKKKGHKCIGCPEGCSCPKSGKGGCGNCGGEA